MKYFYFDSTAFVKHYHLELGSQAVDDLIDHPTNRIILGEPSIADLYAVLNRRMEAGEITRDDFFTTIVTFETEVAQGRFHFLEVDAATLKNVRIMILNHKGLSAQQGLHLALALEMAPLKPTVVSTDPALRQACEAEGLKCLNPEPEFRTLT